MKKRRGTPDDTDLDKILSTVIFLSLSQPFFPVFPARAGTSGGFLPFLFFFFYFYFLGGGRDMVDRTTMQGQKCSQSSADSFKTHKAIPAGGSLRSPSLQPHSASVSHALLTVPSPLKLREGLNLSSRQHVAKCYGANEGSFFFLLVFAEPRRGDGESSTSLNWYATGITMAVTLSSLLKKINK